MTGFALEILKKNKDRAREIALVDRNGSRKITWSCLMDITCRVATYAHQNGISGIVPVYMDRGMEAAATILGLNLAGVGVAPISIKMPKAGCERISAYVNNDIWTTDTFKLAIRSKPAYEICLDGPQADPAYVVFTSGTIGTPKGVMLSNKAIIDGMARDAGKDFFNLDRNDRMLQMASLSFIAVLGDLLTPLYAGCTTYILPEEARGDSRIITNYVNRFGITALFMTPQLYRTFEGGPSIRRVLVGGDRVANIEPKGHELVAVYGLSETAGAVFHHEIKEPEQLAQIGVPCQDIRAYVLDESKKETEEGELCVSGSISDGYLGLPEINEITYTENPFSEDPKYSVLLHTGDIVRRQDNGTLIFVGRKDRIIKINGQKVDLNEIEDAISDYLNIENVAVKTTADDGDRRAICAFYSCRKKVDEEKLRSYLETVFPHYMVPVLFVKIDKMPISANGKTDYKALEIPDPSLLHEKYEKPVGKTEKLICSAIEKVLNIEKVGRNDDFFIIGGDSISALEIVNECSSIGLSARDVFAGRTPKSIAAIASGKHEEFYEKLPRRSKKAKLTSSQMGVLLACGIGEETDKYNVVVHMSFNRTDEMTPDHIKSAVDSVIRNHPALYSDIIEESGNFFMVRKKFAEEGICTVEEVSEKDADELVHGYIRPLAIGRDPLCTAAAYMTESRVHVLISMHHIVSDGTSMEIMTRELGSALSGEKLDPETTDALALYEIESRILKSRACREANTYFTNLLSDTEIDPNLIPDHNLNNNSHLTNGILKVKIDRDTIDSCLNNMDCTRNSFFMTVFGYTLAKMTGQNESLFFAAESGRDDSCLKTTVSMMVKSIPVRIKIDENKTLDDLTKQVQTQFFMSRKNDIADLQSIIEELNLHPDVSFVYQSELLADVETGIGNISLEIVEAAEPRDNFSLMVLKEDDSYVLKFYYCKEMYDEQSIRHFADLYIRVAESSLSKPALRTIQLISDDDRAFLDKENRELEVTPVEGNILDVFRRTVKKFPNKTAVISRDISYTYSQVDEISDRIAAYIHSKGIGRGDVVSVLIPRGEYMMIATFGVLKAGAAYQPLDPSYPEERLSFMISDASAKLLIKDRGLDDKLSDYKGEKLYTDEIAALPAVKTEIEEPKPEDTYVLLYTSGTTGTPKGVMLMHKNLMSFVDAQSQTLMVHEDSVMANYASYGFDAHMADLYPTVYMGATLVIIPDEMRLDLTEVKNYCEKMKVTHLLMTTQVARQFAVQFDKVEHLQVLDCGGEKLVSFEPSKNYTFLNLYGPSECTVCSTGFTVDKYYDNIPIGKARRNNRLYVVDSFGRRLPVGAPGELIICGPQVGKGYLGRDEQTKAAFVENTYENAAAPYDRCYKTGDIVRYINDGNIEYIGRRDHQVKIRGFRIELGEVEKAIRDYPPVKDAAVTVIDNNGAKSICAYVVSDEKINIGNLHSFIGKSHPSYMIPAVTMQIDRIPLNVNGKVDKKKLPEPKMQLEDVKKPQTELQKKIFDKAAEAIGTDGFGVDTNLADAGLSSIGSIRLCTLLAEELGVPVKIRDLRRYPTVEKLEEFAQKALGIESSEDKNPEKVQVTADKAEKTVEYGPSYPITKTMEGIFVECMQKPESTVYNMPLLLKIGTAVDENKLKKAIAAAVEAHPCMKAELFSDEDGKICQHRRINDTYTEKDIRDIKFESETDVNDSIVTPFELTDSRLFEISIIHAGKSRYLFINIHHIISDGTSMAIFKRDIETAYDGHNLQTESFNSFDVADEEVQSRTDDELAYEKDYYSSLLEGLDKDFLLLPDKYLDQEKASGKITLGQMEADADEIRKYCDEHKVGINAFLMSAFGFTLAKYAGNDYSVFNTIYNGRNDSRKMDTVGMLVKTLPVVCHIDKDNVSDVISTMSDQLMDSMANDLYSYAEITKNFGVKNDVMFIYQGDGFIFDQFCGQPAEDMQLSLSDSKTPMNLQVMVRDGKLVYEFEYDPNQFTEKLAVAFIQAFDMAVASFAHEEKISSVSLLSKDAEAEMEKYNNTEFEYDRDKTIVDHFLEMVKKQPEHICVEYNGNKLTYAEVDKLTAKLAAFLMGKGIGRGDRVAILINRDMNMVITAHGAIRTGAAYLGLDPTYPSERLEFMIKDSGSKCLIAERSLMNLIKNYSGDVVYTDEIAGLADPTDEELQKYLSQEKHHIIPEDDALIIYSSGTTGVPKGSVLRHRNIVCFYENYTRDVEIGPDSNVATYASFGFDGGAQDVLSCPMAGAALYVIPDDIRLDLAKLEQFYKKNGITNGFMTTQIGCMFISSTKCRTLKYFLAGGEKFIPVMGPEWVCFRNGYGPSETMCYVNKFRVKDTGTLQPIGTVSNNTKEYIIDKYMNRLPFGACGELCISGGQMGRGYLNLPEKTAEVFVKNPFSTEQGYELMYRTGDVIRMLTDGNYDFVGRRDGQVKIRGFRIELSEVEQQIRKYIGVTKAVVKAYDNPSGGKYLTAYVVMDEELDENKLKEFIGREKPDYMIPAVIMQVDDIPLTSNGKVDASKLPKPKLGSTKKGAEPADETEEKICQIFAEVIGSEKVYADDDFFKIGGSSISAVQVVVKCEHEGFPVVYKNLFANPTAQQLAQFIRGGKESDLTAADLEKNEDYDYSALKYNVLENLPKIDNLGVGNVFLTGATGFLGCHIYRELMDSTSANVVCLVRSKKDIDAQTRFEGMMTYYFEDWYQPSMKERTIVIDGTMEDDDILEKLEPYSIDTIFNCAANVKHFAVEAELMASNFEMVEKLISLAESKKAKLIQISTVSVAGESVNGSVPEGFIFKECDLNIGQSLENKYIYTKYLAEQAVIDAVSKKRINGKIMRLGNLMARNSDSEFQINAGSSGFLRQFLGFKRLGCYPVDMLDTEVEFSPIDRVAKAIVLLAGTPDEFTVFHAKNCNTIHFSYLLKAVMDAGYPIEIVENDVFEQRLQNALKDEKNASELGGLLAYRSSIQTSSEEKSDDGSFKSAEMRISIPSSTTFTTKALYRLGFGWPLISMDYLHEMVKILVDLEFFE